MTLNLSSAITDGYNQYRGPFPGALLYLVSRSVNNPDSEPEIVYSYLFHLRYLKKFSEIVGMDFFGDTGVGKTAQSTQFESLKM
jgi:hypothetical protein